MFSPGDLDLAWRRSKADAGERGFVTHPHLDSLVELDRPGWLKLLLEDVARGYSPGPAVPCFVPKPGAMLRPGCILSPRDEVVYNAVVGGMIAQIWEGLKWSQGDPDIAYQLSPPKKRSSAWVLRGARVWRAWREKSLAHLTSGVSHVVTTDITGFYENIDIQLLASDLRTLGVDEKNLRLLVECLHRWAGPRERGIPQGYTASDILAKLYLSPLDRALKDRGYVHLRYVDDIRIFCPSKNIARLAIRELTELISHRGLNLQSAKTFIKSKGDARAEFQGFGQILDDLTADLANKFKTAAGADPYLSTVALFAALRRRRGPPPEVLERRFKDFFSVAGEGKFDKSLFHFLLGRLAAAGSRVAVGYCLDALRERPEETASVLGYFSDVLLEPAERQRVIEYMDSQDAIYDYQLFEFVRWFFVRGDRDPKVLNLCRRWAFDSNRDPWLRDYSVAYLGAHGDVPDLERIESRYSTLTSDLERATYALSVTRLERARRNAFYSKIRNDGEWVRRAVFLAKQEKPSNRLQVPAGGALADGEGPRPSPSAGGAER